MSLEESVRAVVREEMQRVLRHELRAAIDEFRATPTPGGGEFLSVADAAKLADVSQVTVREWMAKGLKRYGQGRVVRVRRSELVAFLDNSLAAEAEAQQEEQAQAIEEQAIERQAISILARKRRG